MKKIKYGIIFICTLILLVCSFIYYQWFNSSDYVLKHFLDTMIKEDYKKSYKLLDEDYLIDDQLLNLKYFESSFQNLTLNGYKILETKDYINNNKYEVEFIFNGESVQAVIEVNKKNKWRINPEFILDKITLKTLEGVIVDIDGKTYEIDNTGIFQKKCFINFKKDIKLSNEVIADRTITLKANEELTFTEFKIDDKFITKITDYFNGYKDDCNKMQYEGEFKYIEKYYKKDTEWWNNIKEYSDEIAYCRVEGNGGFGRNFEELEYKNIYIDDSLNNLTLSLLETWISWEGGVEQEPDLEINEYFLEKNDKNKWIIVSKIDCLDRILYY